MSDLKWEQGLLISHDIMSSLEKREAEFDNKLFLVTIDGTPTYDTSLLIEQYQIKLENLPLKIFQPETVFTPGRLLHLPSEYELTKKLAINQKNFIEMISGEYENPRVNLGIETPITTIAWILFMKEVSGINSDNLLTHLRFQESVVSHFADDLKTFNSLHIIRKIPQETILNSQTHLKSNSELMLQRLDIFNGCLDTASKIGARIFGKEMTVITS